MDKFTQLNGIAAPMPLINVDTDMIIPKQFLKTIKHTGLGKNLFFDMRYDEQGNEIADFILNRPPYNRASILIAGDNFGCGSSREHAPWSLKDFGIRAIMAPSFADIFYNNCFKNAILPIILPPDIIASLQEKASRGDNARFSIDLNQCTITDPDGEVIAFTLDAFRRDCLLNGWDDIALTLKHENEIAAYEKQRRQDKAWMLVHVD